MNEDAFGQIDEARIVDAARAAGHAVISLVAVSDGRIVGHVLFTPVSLEHATVRTVALGLGPMAVARDMQRQGIGSTLVDAGLRECARLGCALVVVTGHPGFYPRFGFRQAAAYGLLSELDVPAEAFMVAELKAGALTGVRGLVRYGPEFGSH